MATTIHVERSHGLTQEEAIRRAQELIQNLNSKMKLEVKWSGDGATFKGTGFSGTAVVADKRIVFDLELGLLLRPLKSQIEERIDRTISKRFT